MPSCLEPPLRCFHCQFIAPPKISHQDFKDGSRHLRATCSSCGAWIKWLPWDELKFYVGKYTGQSIRSVCRNDPDYAIWAKANLRLSASSRSVFAEEGIK